MTGGAPRPIPWVGATQCTLPFGSRIDVGQFSFYTVKPPTSISPGTSSPTRSTSAGTTSATTPAKTGNTNCNPDPPTNGAASQSVITQIPSTTATTIHNAAHAAVTAVPAGSTVHDFVTVSGSAGNPVPTGTVTLDWFTNNTCTGTPASTSAELPLATVRSMRPRSRRARSRSASSDSWPTTRATRPTRPT